MKINLQKARVVFYYFRPILIILGVLSFWSISLIPLKAQAIIGQRVLGSSGLERATAITTDSEGNYIVAGPTAYGNDGDVSGSHGDSDFWVVKLNSYTGDILWQKALGGSNTDVATGIAPTSDGGCVVAGYTTSTDGDVTGNHGFVDFWVVRLNQSGAIVWQKTYGGTNGDNAWGIAASADGNFFVVGSSNSTNGDVSGNHGNGDAWVLKLSGSGDIIWQKSLGGSSDDRANAVIATSDGGCVLAGYTLSNDGDVHDNHGGLDFWTVRLNSSGSILWQRALGGSNHDLAYAIAATSDGGFVATGYTYSNDGQVTGNHGQNDFWVVKLTATGNLIWQKTLGGSSLEVAYAVSATPDGGYLVFGETTSTDGDVTNNHGSNDGWVVKLSGVGEKVWQRALGGSGVDEIYAVTTNRAGHFILAGDTGSIDGDLASAGGKVHGVGISDFWVVILLVEPLQLLPPTYNCQTGAITFNTVGGDFSPITFAAPGITRSSPTSTTGIVEVELRRDPKPIVIRAQQGTQTATYVFDLGAACPSSDNRLILLQPTYTCETGAIHFNTKGGDGSPIEFRSVPGITDWTTDPDQFVDRESRTASDVQPFTLEARQNGVITTFNWDLKAACGRARSGIQENSAGLQVKLLGNPLEDQYVELVLCGVANQLVDLKIVSLLGHTILHKIIQPVSDAEPVRMSLNSESGLLFLEVVAGEQRKVIKLIKP